MKAPKIILLILAAAAICLFFWLDLGQFLTLAALKAHHQTLMEFQAAHKALTAIGFMLLYIAQTALSLPGAAMLSLAAGALFGTVLGTVYANIAATVGATLAFLATRYLLREAVQGRFGDKLTVINREIENGGFHYLLFLRLVPAFPFFLVNLAAGLTRLPLRTFYLATMLGIIPGGVVYVNAGASLATIDSLAGIVSPRVLGSFALLGLFALAPVLYGKFKTKR